VVLLLVLGLAASVFLARREGHHLEGAGRALESVEGRLAGARLKASVRLAFELHRDLAPLPIDVRADGAGQVILEGEAPAPDLVRAAEAVAAAVPGVRRVENRLRVRAGASPAAPPGEPARTLGEKVDDEALEAKIRLAFSLNRALQGTRLSVRSRLREVALEGSVSRAEQKDLAVEIAGRTPGVRRITDRIRVAAES
jgi:osmotically-inducible protein OsmY